MIIEKNREERFKEISHQSWLTGVYVCEAIATCFSKNHKYPPKSRDTKFWGSWRNVEKDRKIRSRTYTGRTILCNASSPSKRKYIEIIKIKGRGLKIFPFIFLSNI